MEKNFEYVPVCPILGFSCPQSDGEHCKAPDGPENCSSVQQSLLLKKSAQWCSCDGWKAGWKSLANHDQMNFCAFCGEKLKKG